MKADLLRRLDALEAVAKRVDIPPLRLIDVLTFDPVDLETFRSGPEGERAVMTAIGVPVDGESMGRVHTIVIDIHPAMRDRWQATHDLDGDDLEAFEQRAILEDQRREKEAAEVAKLAAMRVAQNQLPTAPANAYAPVPIERD